MKEGAEWIGSLQEIVSLEMTTKTAIIFNRLFHNGWQHILYLVSD